MKKLLALLLVLGLAFAQSLVVEVRGSLEEVEAKTLQALKSVGLEADRVLNLGEQVRQVTGPGFPDYRLVVLKPEKGSVEAVSKNPMAAIVPPPRSSSPARARSTWWGPLTAGSSSACFRSTGARWSGLFGVWRPPSAAWAWSSASLPP
jgi:hypothetical protein